MKQAHYIMGLVLLGEMTEEELTQVWSLVDHEYQKEGVAIMIGLKARKAG